MLIMIAGLTNEAVKLVHQKITESPDEVDLGFPEFELPLSQIDDAKVPAPGDDLTASQETSVIPTIRRHIDEIEGVDEYADDIIAYMNHFDAEIMPIGEYMSFQEDLTWEDRHSLLEWLLHVHSCSNMRQNTLWISVNLVDRFLSRQQTPSVALHLLGIAALVIAAKYEESPTWWIDAFVKLCDGKYSAEDIVCAEYRLLQELDYNVSAYSSPHSWIACTSTKDWADDAHIMRNFICEVTIFDKCFLNLTPSRVAAVGTFIVTHMLNQDWVSGFRAAEVFKLDLNIASGRAHTAHVEYRE